MYETIEEIRAANKRIGNHWFDEDTMAFFHTIVLPTVYGGRYFLTTEPYAWDGPRVWTIREAREDGTVETVGEMGQYETFDEAEQAVKQLAAE